MGCYIDSATAPKPQLPGEACARAPALESRKCEDRPIANPNLLDEAKRVVDGDRRDEYGDALTCFKRIASMWSDYLDITINHYDVAKMMILLKICRSHQKDFQRDSFLDIAGYSYCAEKMHKREKDIKREYD